MSKMMNEMTIRELHVAMDEAMDTLPADDIDSYRREIASRILNLGGRLHIPTPSPCTPTEGAYYAYKAADAIEAAFVTATPAAIAIRAATLYVMALCARAQAARAPDNDHDRALYAQSAAFLAHEAAEHAAYRALNDSRGRAEGSNCDK